MDTRADDAGEVQHDDDDYDEDDDSGGDQGAATSAGRLRPLEPVSRSLVDEKAVDEAGASKDLRRRHALAAASSPST